MDPRTGDSKSTVKKEPYDSGASRDRTGRDASVASPHHRHHRHCSCDGHHRCRRHRRDGSRHRKVDTPGDRAAPNPRPATDAHTTSGLRASVGASGATGGGAAAGGGGSSPGGPGDGRDGGAPRKSRDSRFRSGGPGGPGDPYSSGSDSYSRSSSSDSDSVSDTSERRLHYKEIDTKRKGVFVITSEKLRNAKKTSQKTTCVVRSKSSHEEPT